MASVRNFVMVAPYMQGAIQELLYVTFFSRNLTQPPPRNTNNVETCTIVTPLGPPLKYYMMLFSWEFDPHPHTRKANNVEPYIFVTFFSGKVTPPTTHCVS